MEQPIVLPTMQKLQHVSTNRSQPRAARGGTHEHIALIECCARLKMLVPTVDFKGPATITAAVDSPPTYLYIFYISIYLHGITQMLF